MLNTFLEWIDYWAAIFGITGVGWVQRTTQWAGEWYEKALSLYTTWWGKTAWYNDFFTFNWIKAAIALAQKIGEIFDYRYFWVEEVFTNLVTRWRQTFVLWWDRLVEVFDTNWSWVQKWYSDWVRYVTWLLDNYKERIHYALVTDWPKLWWLISERFEDLHNVFEFNLAGWKVFIDDPGQAIWDWIKPRLQELVATFLVEIW